MDKKLKEEYKTVCEMIDLYHRKNDRFSDGDISELKAYVKRKLSSCPHGSSKPFCSYCKIHCYEPVRRAEILDIMRFSGPRFIFYRPGKAIKHILHKSSFIRKLASKKAYRKYFL
ncbi:MAG: nitrous oxide-stimulated promoter family protein [Anaerococcus sp.]|uniref:nitrous oxide-stimulated promoter family protein n=1 Tax=Anaerococcus sp. TaxID=1872515 RepID=UPI002622E6F8|nr:nitrous oxide-stimulated promoter family protein [Anaerococcus sp.]MCI5972127.1 nitrous oxide-stimulated promoter family protein [Anaerococcus sp.]MDD6918328.1 nitrous oxide-stimulated promoter family protein [Peptoniphilaceae bacterium]MDY2928581.1 nitrous oxide-stimulated promoter family protein [Anaerococcus sp.]